MAITPKTYAQIGAALFNKDWVYRMRELLDIRKPVAEQIAVAAGRGEPAEVPDGIEAPLREALLAKIAACEAALVLLGGKTADAAQLDAIYWKLMAWLKPEPGVPADETLLQIVELFEARGRGFVKVDYPAND